MFPATRARFALLASVAVCAGLGGGFGCLPAKRDAYRSSAPIRVRFDSPDSDRLWNAAREVLRAHRFTLDRVDRRRGVITTMPETSQGVGEFWRSDVATREDLWESTINAMRRKVIVRFGQAAPGDTESGAREEASGGDESVVTIEARGGSNESASGEAGEWTSLEVVVQKERFSSKERQFTSTGAVYQVFGSQLPSMTGEVLTEADDRWVDQGRDPAMEERIVSEIVRLAELPERSGAVQGDAGD